MFKEAYSRKLTCHFLLILAHLLKALSHEAIFSCNVQRKDVSNCILQEKSPPVTLLVCKIIRLQVIQQLAYVYNSTGACNIFFTQICVPSCKKKLPRVKKLLLRCWGNGFDAYTGIYLFMSAVGTEEKWIGISQIFGEERLGKKKNISVLCLKLLIQHKTEFTCSKTLSGETSYCKYFPNIHSDAGKGRGGGRPPPTPLPSFCVPGPVCKGWQNRKFHFEEIIFVGSYLGCMCKQAIDILAGVVPAHDHDYLRTVREDLTTVYEVDVAGRPS